MDTQLEMWSAPDDQPLTYHRLVTKRPPKIKPLPAFCPKCHGKQVFHERQLGGDTDIVCLGCGWREY